MSATRRKRIRGDELGRIYWPADIPEPANYQPQLLLLGPADLGDPAFLRQFLQLLDQALVPRASRIGLIALARLLLALLQALAATLLEISHHLVRQLHYFRELVLLQAPETALLQFRQNLIRFLQYFASFGYNASAHQAWALALGICLILLEKSFDLSIAHSTPRELTPFCHIVTTNL